MYRLAIRVGTVFFLRGTHINKGPEAETYALGGSGIPGNQV
jgi:hypothetical protein